MVEWVSREVGLRWCRMMEHVMQILCACVVGEKKGTPNLILRT